MHTTNITINYYYILVDSNLDLIQSGKLNTAVLHIAIPSILLDFLHSSLSYLSGSDTLFVLVEDDITFFFDEQALSERAVQGIPSGLLLQVKLEIHIQEFAKYRRIVVVIILQDSLDCLGNLGSVIWLTKNN